MFPPATICIFMRPKRYAATYHHCFYIVWHAVVVVVALVANIVVILSYIIVVIAVIIEMLGCRAYSPACCIDLLPNSVRFMFAFTFAQALDFSAARRRRLTTNYFKYRFFIFISKFEFLFSLLFFLLIFLLISRSVY